jgi:hypothetical protein
MNDESSKTPEEQEPQPLSFDLDFTPEWARTPPTNPYAGREDWGERPESPRGGHPGGGRRPGGPRRDGGGKGRPGFRGPREDRRRDGDRDARRRPEGGFSRRPRDGAPGGRGDRGRREGRPDDRRREDGRGRFPFRPREHLDVRVTFLPDRDCLSRVVEDIRVTGRAFPLLDIAKKFLAREDLYQVKLELGAPDWRKKPSEKKPAAGGTEAPEAAPAAEAAAAPEAPAKPKTLCQCLVCKRVFRTRANAEAHAVSAHLDRFFDKEELSVEPPQGEFTCVARCGLSGELLGPPNQHGYNERIQEIWSSRYPHMSRGEYLSRIETLRDPDLLEKWKDSMRTKVVYRLKAEPPKKAAKPEKAEGEAKAEEAPAVPAPEAAEGAEAPAAEAPEAASAAEPAPEAPAEDTRPTFSRRQAEEWARANRMSHLVRESARCLMPGAVSRQFDDGALRGAVGGAWVRESRFPLTLSLSLRPAFRHMHLHLFKLGGRETYVSAIAPLPVDFAGLDGVSREIGAYLQANPGKSRRELLEALRPGMAADSEEATALLSLVSKHISEGNIVCLFDGTLHLPLAANAAASAAQPESGATAEGEAPAAEEAPVAEETPAVEESAPAEEVPAAVEEVSAVEEVPAPEAEAPVAEEPEAPAAEESPASAEKTETPTEAASGGEEAGA